MPPLLSLLPLMVMTRPSMSSYRVVVQALSSNPARRRNTSSRLRELSIDFLLLRLCGTLQAPEHLFARAKCQSKAAAFSDRIPVRDIETASPLTLVYSEKTGRTRAHNF